MPRNGATVGVVDPFVGAYVSDDKKVEDITFYIDGHEIPDGWVYQWPPVEHLYFVALYMS